MTRISGYGPGLGGGGQPRQRADQFRARHRIGERLRGRILRHEPGGLTVVEVDGQELLARLEVLAEPGDALNFVVRALLPEIHLQALQGESASVDPPGLLQQFRTARHAFETRAAQHLAALPFTLPPSAVATPAFLALLALDESFDALHGEAQARLASLDQNLARPLGRRAFYLPWAAPGLSQCEAMLAPSGEGFDLAASGRMERYGVFELRLLGSRGQHRLRLWLERRDRAEELAALAREALAKAGCGTAGFSVGRISSPVPGGVFTELVGESARESGGLNARV